MYLRARFAVFALFVSLVPYNLVLAQSLTSGTIEGKVTDPTGAVIPGATVDIENPVSGFKQSATTNAAGNFSFQNVPFNPYHLRATAKGFETVQEDVTVRSPVPLNLEITLQIAGTSETINVEASGQDLVENDSTAHTDINGSLARMLPKESVSTGLSSVIIQASPASRRTPMECFTRWGNTRIPRSAWTTSPFPTSKAAPSPTSSP